MDKDMEQLHLNKVTEAELQELAHTLAQKAQGTEIILLDGDLGAGKTVFAKAFARGLGISQPVTSPTFTLMNVYATDKGQFLHLDLYRLEDPSEVEYLGLQENFDEAVMIIEWAQRLPELPTHFLAIDIASHDLLHRNLLIRARGDAEEKMLQEMKKIADSFS